MELFTVAAYVATCLIVYTAVKIIAGMVRRQLLHNRISKSGAPPSLPFIGSAHLLLGSTDVIMNRMIELFKSYSSPVPVWIGNHLIFAITTPEHIKAVCRSDKMLGRSAFSNFGDSFVGTGLFTAPVEKWRVHRPLIQQSFTPKNLQSFVGTFAAEAVSMVDAMEQYLDGPEFEILHPHIVNYSLNTICETTVGVNLTEHPDGHHYADMVEKVLASMLERIFHLWLHPDFIFYRTRLGKTQQEDLTSVNDFADKVIQMRRKEHLERRSQSEPADNNGEKRSSQPRTMTLLDPLILMSCNNETLSDKVLRDEVNTMIVGGYDTIATASCFAMLALASNPKIQNQAYQELYEIYGEDDSQEVLVTTEDLSHMQYLERVIKETLRLFPIAPIITRAVVEDFDIGDTTIPNGSSICLGIIDLHRNENYWPDPMKFDPDRFLPDEVAKRHPFAYLPFGGGIRSCIGTRYAMMSMKTLLATVLRRYILIKDDIIPVEDFPLQYKFLVQPLDPIMLRIEKRIRNDNPYNYTHSSAAQSHRISSSSQ